MLRRVLMLTVALAAGGLPVGAASAAPRQESLFQDDDLLLHAAPADVEEAFDELRRLGVDRVRLSAIWRDHTPRRRPADLRDPASYDPDLLDSLDVAITTAHRHGIDVLLNVRGGAPDWAQPRGRPASLRDRAAYKPRAGPFGDFTAMLGRRYDGTYLDEGEDGEVLPRVSAWSLWNEPNWGGLLQPQAERDPRTGGLRPFAPRHYRALFRASREALSATGHGTDVILLGETAPLGSTQPDSIGSHLSPGRFLRSLFCLDERLEPLRGRAARAERCDFRRRGPLDATGYGHHPYPVVEPPERPSEDPDHFRLADAARLTRVLDAARRHGRLPGRLPLWYTEFGYQTRPPDPVRGIGLGRHAAWLTRAERMTYADRRVLAHTQFLLRDSGPNPGTRPSDPHHWSTYQTGIEYADGRAKPAYAAYRLPFLALDRLRPGRPVRLWGMVRPGRPGRAHTVRIEHRAPRSSGWTPVQTLSVFDPKGYFTVRLARAAAGQYRFAWLDDEHPLSSAPAVASR